MAGSGSPASFCPLPTTIVHFLIQVKPPTDAKSDDGVSSFLAQEQGVRPSTPPLFNAAQYSDLKDEHHSFPKLRLDLRLSGP
jgi:hypothetical protein